ncbi:PLP-dependent aminotransferase family protein [Acidiluteibacter ferrifornacis]|uniref:Cystathionine beta-synthase n=1 Tax=Acidiluteibacter ferrifornacis TaxID=2692424 RepID=A0A6N9NQ96_9FLAO|nr:PLP-dependent transferase [Acidiluteibacter ferrifornacis]NBG67451.1 cystathionine beta-synthase [Acidiluteibacter ferrifornacis]
MENSKTLQYIQDLIQNLPTGWLNITTHRLDIYNEELAKTEFLDQLEGLYQKNVVTAEALNGLPTAYDYIRLGHPLSCVLEWGIAKLNDIPAKNVIAFSSQTMPIMAILRTNAMENKNTQIYFNGELPDSFDPDLIQKIYGYPFELIQVDSLSSIKPSELNSTVFITNSEKIGCFDLNHPNAPHIDFFISLHCGNYTGDLGSVLLVNGEKNERYISNIQHVRRRETIAMTPANSLTALQLLVNTPYEISNTDDKRENKIKVQNLINLITGTTTKSLVASSGLSIQYAILMGLIHDAKEKHQGKAIKIIVPPNCYGGTNDQARRVAACTENVSIVDLPVDGGNDMVKSIDQVLTKIASEDAIPYIIAEIPTNPRVEVPNLNQLKAVLSQERKTTGGQIAIDPVFILDQTFCPNVHFLGEGEALSAIRTISFASGSKFPSGGKCTAGYCVGNKNTVNLMDKIELHLHLCDNEATELQYAILAEQLPSMTQRIIDAYKNTREFVNYIHSTLPDAKINFVSEELAAQGFTPSVFSLDLPTRGNTDEEREMYKRALNLKLINLMITEIPEESKFCVSYGQLKGCYWTIPATSTQGTTKEGDKDYIVRASLSANMDLEKHKKVFLDFVNSI